MPTPTTRADAARRGTLLSRITLVYNTGECVAALIAGLLAGSIALVSFGMDSVIEVISSAASLIGVLLNVLLGWWWADPVAALAMVPIIVKAGHEGLRGEVTCDDCC